MSIYNSTEDKSLRQVIKLLEPRYAPETSIKFIPPDKKLSLRSKFIVWSSRVAAVFFIAGIITFLIGQSQTTNGAVKVLESGIDNIRTSGYCNIDFSARILPAKTKSPLKMSPRGELRPVSLTFTSDSILNKIILKWTDKYSHHKLIMFAGNVIEVDNSLISDITIPSSVFSILSNLLLSPDPDYSSVLDSENIKMKTKGDEISIRNSGKNNKVEFCIKFSKSSHRLLDFVAYDTSYGEKILMIKTDKITYKNNLMTK